MQTLRLNEAKSIIKSKVFPSFNKSINKYKYQALIGLGGNIGDTKKRFEIFLYKIKKDKRFFIKESSIILKNSAFGFKEQDDFLNAVILIETSLYAGEILKLMQHFEQIFRRKRSFKNAPRTLDLDILYFSKKTRNSPRLKLPHPGASARLSVIIPIGSMKGI